MSTLRVALDFNCSPRLVGALSSLYGHRGFQFLHLEKLVHGRTDDEIWADAYKKFGGKIVISGDARIAYRPHQAVAFIDNGFISFFPSESWSQMPGSAKSALLIHSWPLIEAKISQAKEGSCWRIPCSYSKKDMELKLRNDPLHPLEIPNEVLVKERLRRSGQG